MPVTVKTDHKWRDLVFSADVPEAVLKSDFDYQNPEEIFDGFFKYRGRWRHLDEFMTIANNPDLAGWDGYASDSYFSGVLIKFSEDCEQIKIGTYYS